MNQAIATTTISGATVCTEHLEESLSNLVDKQILDFRPVDSDGNAKGFEVFIRGDGVEALQAIIEGVLSDCVSELQAVSKVNNTTAFYFPIFIIIVILVIQLMFNILQWRNPHKDNAR